MMKYVSVLRLPGGSTDAKGNLHPQTVLKIFQDIAGEHAKELGCGYEELLARRLLWVVIRIRYQVCGDPAPEEPLTAATWPHPPNRAGYGRDYLISGADGSPLIRGTSNWAIIDAASRRLAPVQDLYSGKEYYPEHTFDERIRRLKDFEAPPACRIVPGAEAIDRNGHVNNTFYAAYAEQALGGFPGKIQTFQIDFLHEVLAGQPLTLFTEEEDGGVQIKGESAEGKRMFACAVSFFQHTA